MRVFLVGLMGSGKTAIGRRLARRLAWPYLDNDALLVEREGRDLMALSRQGEAVLHEAEARLAADLCEHQPPVVAGIPASLGDRPEILAQLAAAGLLVYLRTRPATLAARVAHGNERPFLAEDPRGALAGALEARGPAFEQAAGLVVDTDAATPDQLAEEIAAVAVGRGAQGRGGA